MNLADDIGNAQRNRAANLVATTIAHHLSEGNPRAEVLFASRGRLFMLVFAAPHEPRDDERTARVKLAEAALRK